MNLVTFVVTLLYLTMTFRYTIRYEKKIYIDFSYGRANRFRRATGEVLVNGKNWDVNSEKVRVVAEEKNAININKRLRNLKTKFIDGYEELINDEELIDSVSLKSMLKRLDNNKVEILKKKRLDFNDLFEEYIEYSAKYKRTRKGLLLTKGTVSTYKQAYNSLKLFQEEHGKIKVKNINKTLYLRLVSFFEQKGYSHNNVGKIIAKTKTFLRYLITDKKITLTDYYPSDWMVQKEEVESIYLTNSELVKMMNVPGLSERETRALDLFIIGAFTGLRVSDYNRLSKKNIVEFKNKKYFRITSKKTNNEVIIPISEIVFQVLGKNKGIPKSMTEQEINKLIKIIGEYAGIDESFSITRTVGGKQITEKKLKFELIMTHTARRSFCTNAYLGGLDSISIMALSGHTTESNFLKYIKVTKQEQAERIASHPYFQSLNSANFSSTKTSELKAV